MRFDTTRKNNRHVAFGTGACYCLGAAPARVESDECFRLLLSRFPDLRPAAAPRPLWGQTADHASSTGSTTPLTLLAASDASHTIAAACSSAVAILPMTAPRMPPMTSVP